MSDLIDREAAVDALTKCAETYKRDWDKWDSAEAFGGYCGIGSAISEIEELPSVQQWIPCSERLPDKEIIYLVTFACGVVGTSSWHESTTYNRGFDNYMTGYYENGDTKNFGVIAWMPLPEPYKGDEDEVSG